MRWGGWKTEWTDSSEGKGVGRQGVSEVEKSCDAVLASATHTGRVTLRQALAPYLPISEVREIMETVSLTSIIFISPR